MDRENFFDLDSYHEKGQCSTKKHQQAAPSNMPRIIKVTALFKFIPRIKYKR